MRPSLIPARRIVSFGLAAFGLAAFTLAGCQCERSGSSEPEIKATPAAAATEQAHRDAPAADEGDDVIAFIDAEPELGPAPLTVQFSVWDPFQTMLNPEYKWDFGDGQSSTQRSPKHTYNAPGDYEVSLIVTDGGNSDSDSLDIEVLEPNDPE